MREVRITAKRIVLVVSVVLLLSGAALASGHFHLADHKGHYWHQRYYPAEPIITPSAAAGSMTIDEVEYNGFHTSSNWVIIETEYAQPISSWTFRVNGGPIVQFSTTAILQPGVLYYFTASNMDSGKISLNDPSGNVIDSEQMDAPNGIIIYGNSFQLDGYDNWVYAPQTGDLTQAIYLGGV